MLTNTVSRRKAALIYPVEAMNISTANALLKTLEEPPGETVMILVSSNPARLPATIRSRCQSLNVRVPDRDAALEWLSAQAGSAGPDQLALALQAAAGIPLRALSMLEDGGVEHYEELVSALEDLLAGRQTAAQAMATVADFDPDRLWSWLSLRAAAETRASPGVADRSRKAAALQAQADRGRALSRTPLRKDFLIRDWLIQWARLNP